MLHNCEDKSTLLPKNFFSIYLYIYTYAYFICCLIAIDSNSNSKEDTNCKNEEHWLFYRRYFLNHSRCALYTHCSYNMFLLSPATFLILIFGFCMCTLFLFGHFFFLDFMIWGRYRTVRYLGLDHHIQDCIYSSI